MSNILKRILAALLAALMVFSAAACSADPTSADGGSNDTADAANTDINPQGADGEPIEDENGRIQYDLPAEDFGGYDFRFLTAEFDGNGYWGSVEIFAEELNAIPLNDSVYERNNVIKDRYNINISEIRTNDFNNLVTNTVSAGDNAYDCVMPKIPAAATMATAGQLVPFRILANIDLSKPWWDQSSNEQLSIARDHYYAMGDLNILDNEATYVIMFNKDVAEDFSVPNLYDMVKNNEWTFDKLREIALNVTLDVNADGKLNENDRIGLLTDESAVRNGMFYGAGCTFFAKNADDVPVLEADLERAASVLEKIIAISDDKNVAILANNLTHISDPWTNGLNVMFKEGNGLFYGIGLTVMSKMRDMDSDFGLLPYPKFNSSQKDYISYVAAHCANVIAVPTTCTDYNMVSLVLESMAYESKYSVTPTYYDITITNKTMRDAESADMLNIIFEHRAYDLGEIFNWGGIGSIVTSLKDANTLASNFKKKQRVGALAIDKTMDRIMDIKDNY